MRRMYGGDGLALSWPMMSGALPCGWQRVLVTDYGARGHTHAANEAASQIGEDVTKHVLHDQHIGFPRLAHGQSLRIRSYNPSGRDS